MSHTSIQWAKVTYNFKTKRLQKPASDLPEFLKQIRSHFPELSRIPFMSETHARIELSWHSMSALQ